MPPHNSQSNNITIQQEMGIRTRQFSYRVANAGIVGIISAYVGDPWVTNYFRTLAPTSGRFLTQPLTSILPNILCMRMPTYNVVCICGVSQPTQVLDLASGAAQIQPLYGIPGKVFGVIWDVSDSVIQFITNCFGNISSQSRWLCFGHSMGSSLTYHTVARLIQQFHVPASNIIGCYGFAGPKPGDPTFANWISEQVPCFSIHALGDPVPSAPPIGSQFFYNAINGLNTITGQGSMSLEFNYQHVRPVWQLQPDGHTRQGGLAFLAIGGK